MFTVTDPVGFLLSADLSSVSSGCFRRGNKDQKRWPMIPLWLVMFRNTWQRLGQRSIRYIFEIPGHGQAGSGPYARFHLARRVAAVFELLESFLLGNSRKRPSLNRGSAGNARIVRWSQLDQA